MTRSYHSVSRSGVEATAKELPVMVYDSPEFQSFSSASSNSSGNVSSWDSQVMASPHRSKFFSLLPFQIESKLTAKSYVLRMEVFPDSKFLRLHTLKLNGVQQVYLPIAEVVPITKYDYWAASWQLWMKQHNCLDLDMIYASQTTKEMFLFDKGGKWHDEGVYSKALNMDSTYNETNWFDEFNPQSF